LKGFWFLLLKLSENNVLLSLRKKPDCFQIMATLSQQNLSQFYSYLTKEKNSISSLADTFLCVRAEK
jgi:hypothetical protein